MTSDQFHIPYDQFLITHGQFVMTSDQSSSLYKMMTRTGHQIDW
jgi:hypothetical protein